MALSDKRYVFVLLILFLILWSALAIKPYYRDDWMLENVLTAITLLLLVFTYKSMPFSNASYLIIFLFLSLHTLGSHYTYAEVPYDKWVISLTGGSLDALMGWQRNQFDRLAHFVYGLLIVYPIQELFAKITLVKKGMAYFVAVLIVMSSSMLYEIVEWGAAEVFGGDLGIAYLGIQGDVWDAHKDMLLASVGAVITAVVLIYYPRLKLSK